MAYVHTCFLFTFCATLLVALCLCDVSVSHINVLTRKLCRIHLDTANCSGQGRNLTYIPELGQRIHRLIFNKNYLPFVSHVTFENISVVNIEKLTLEHDGIQRITANAFSGFINLQYLNLAGNNITVNQLEKLLQLLLKTESLRSLCLNSMFIPKIVFSNITESNLTILSLAFNSLTTIYKDMFQMFKKVQLLYLKHNRITKMQVPALKHLKTLVLSFNDLETFPNFCDETLKETYTPSIVSLFIQNNKIRSVNSTNFKCLKTLISLNLAENYIVELQADLLSKLHNIKFLRLDFMRIPFVTIYPKAFRSPTLQSLNVRNKYKAKNMFVYPNETFMHSPNLEKLSMRFINFFGTTEDWLTNLLSNLSNLKKLDMVNCQLTYFPIQVIKNKPKLYQVRLSDNRISSIKFAAYENVSQLFLNNNQILEINPDDLPGKNLQVLNMSNNPFVCECALNPFISWLRHHINNVNLEHYPNGYVCASPSHMKGKLLSDMSFTYRKCHPWGAGIWVGVTGGPPVILFIVIAIIAYKYRWNIKHYVFLLRKRRQYQQLDGHDFVFDAFVGYNQIDYEWVYDQLLPMLEEQSGYKLCIHDRDFRPGVYIHDNITKCMEDSRKIIIILTNEFAKSGWCTFELKLAHTKHIEDGTDLIVVMLQKPEARYINKSLKLLLQTTTFIEWSNNEVGRLLFWEKLKDAIK